MNLKVKQILLDLNEDTLFRLFSFIYKDIINLNTDDPYSDADWYIPSKNAYIEAKCRDKHYRHLFLQKDKYEKLIQYDNSFYVNTTPDGIWIWNMKKIEPMWVDRVMNKTKYYYNNDPVYKKVAELSIEYAKNITDYLIKEN